MAWPALLAMIGKGLMTAMKGAQGSGMGQAIAGGLGKIGGAAQQVGGAIQEGGATLAQGVQKGLSNEDVQQMLLESAVGAKTARGQTTASTGIGKRTEPGAPPPPPGTSETGPPPVQGPRIEQTHSSEQGGLWSKIQNMMIGPGAADLDPESRSQAFQHSLFRAISTGHPAGGTTVGREALYNQKNREREEHLQGQLELATDPRVRSQIQSQIRGTTPIKYPGPPQTKTTPVGDDQVQPWDWTGGELGTQGQWEKSGEPYSRTAPQHPVRPTFGQIQGMRRGRQVFTEMEGMSPFEVRSMSLFRPDEYDEATSPFHKEEPEVYKKRMEKHRNRLKGVTMKAPGPEDMEFRSEDGRIMKRVKKGENVWEDSKTGRKFYWDPEEE